MTESIGKIYETVVPSLSDSANIQEALRVYHYGKTTGTNPDTEYNTQNETLSALPPKSIASYLNNLQTQITNVGSVISPEFYAKKGNIVSSDFDGSPKVLELSPGFPLTIAQNGLLLTSDDSAPTGLRWQAPDITLTNIQSISNKTFINSTIAAAGLKFLESGVSPEFTTTLISPDQGSNKVVVFPTTNAELPGVNTTLVGTNTIQTLTNKTLTSPTINSSTISGATISTSTVQNGGAVVGTTATQTLTNKTISLEAANNTITGRLASTSGGTPAGVISQYAGTAAPAGYLLCQGQSISTTTFADLFAAIGYNYGGSGGSFNLPNLQNRVPVGKGSGTFGSLNSTGGAETHTLTVDQMPSHTHVQDSHNHGQDAHAHGASSGDAGSHGHTASTNTAGAHTHLNSASHTHQAYRGISASRATGTSGGIQSTNVSVAISDTTTAATHINSSAGGHTHTVTIDDNGSHSHTVSVNNATAVNQATTATNQNTGGGAAHNNLQPYIVVNYIIKT